MAFGRVLRPHDWPALLPDACRALVHGHLRFLLIGIRQWCVPWNPLISARGPTPSLHLGPSAGATAHRSGTNKADRSSGCAAEFAATERLVFPHLSGSSCSAPLLRLRCSRSVRQGGEFHCRQRICWQRDSTLACFLNKFGGGKPRAQL